MISKAELEFHRLLKNKILTKDDLNVIRLWINEMEEFGPSRIASSKFWEDHALEGVWNGFRASCYSGPGRIIYRVMHEDSIVEVYKVSPDHNYNR